MERARSRQIVIERHPNQTPNEETAMQGDESGDEQQGTETGDVEHFDWEQIVTF